jgi:Na+/melibiose symporter-like transporter
MAAKRYNLVSEGLLFGENCSITRNPPGGEMNLWLKRIARTSAWVLLVCVAVLFFSGWGITQTGVIYQITFGLVDRRLADSIHRATNLPLAFFFLLHVLINIRLHITSRRPYIVWLTNGVLIAIGVCIMWLVVYMEYFRLGG